MHVARSARSFEADEAAPWAGSFEIRLGPGVYRLRVAGGRLVEVARGEAADGPDARLATDPETFAALLDGGERLAAAAAAGRVAVGGDAEAVQRLLDAVRTPTQALPR